MLRSFFESSSPAFGKTLTEQRAETGFLLFALSKKTQRGRKR